MNQAIEEFAIPALVAVVILAVASAGVYTVYCAWKAWGPKPSPTIALERDAWACTLYATRSSMVLYPNGRGGTYMVPITRSDCVKYEAREQ